MKTTVKTVEQFLSDQALVLQLCGEIMPQARFYKRVHSRLMELEGFLVRYIQAQDDGFFMELGRRHAKDGNKLKMIEFWKVDLKDLKIKIFLFFEHYGKDPLAKGNAHLGKDFLDLFNAIKTHFEIQKNYLFPSLC
jgi:hypothetical protein